MSKAFLADLSFLTAAADEAVPQRERLQLLVIGSREGVTKTIHNLHRRGFAEAGAWSPLLPAPNPGEVMSILTRYRVISPEA